MRAVASRLNRLNNSPTRIQAAVEDAGFALQRPAPGADVFTGEVNYRIGLLYKRQPAMRRLTIPANRFYTRR